MQQDEEVGKVAIATPIVVSKAVEMFMQALITAACFEAQSCNSQRVLPQHL